MALVSIRATSSVTIPILNPSLPCASFFVLRRSLAVYKNSRWIFVVSKRNCEIVIDLAHFAGLSLDRHRVRSAVGFGPEGWYGRWGRPVPSALQPALGIEIEAGRVYFVLSCSFQMLCFWYVKVTLKRLRNSLACTAAPYHYRFAETRYQEPIRVKNEQRQSIRPAYLFLNCNESIILFLFGNSFTFDLVIVALS